MIEEGTPMKIIVSDLATRGTDFSSTNPLTAFKMYSTLDSYWTAGKLMEYINENWTTNNTLTWPDNAEHTFFAINVEEDTEFADVAENIEDPNIFGAGDGNPDLPVIGDNSCSFNYKMPISKKPKENDDDPDEFYYNSENLKDLLVATSIGGKEYEPVYNDPVNGETKYEAGSILVNFTHALAQISGVKLYVNYDRLNDQEETIAATSLLTVFRIGGMRIGGLKTLGKYTFGATTPWTVDDPGNGINEDVFEIPLKYDDFDHTVFYAKGSAANKFELILSDDGFYLIPQKATGKLKYLGNDQYEIEGAYVELDAQVFQTDDYPVEDLQPGDNPDKNKGNYRVAKDLDNENYYFYWGTTASEKMGYGKIRCPLKFALLEGNKTYTLVLDLGMAIIQSSGLDGEANQKEAVFAGLEINAG